MGGQQSGAAEQKEEREEGLEVEKPGGQTGRASQPEREREREREM